MNKKMNREELIAIAKKIINLETASEEEEDDLIALFTNNVPHPNASNLFFSKENDGLTPEEIVDKALSYKPTQL